MTPGCLRVAVHDPAEAELITDLLWSSDATAIGERDGAPGIVLDAGFVDEGAARRAAAAVGERFRSADVEVVDAGPALEAALDVWKEHARPLRMAGLHVRYPWSAADDDPPRAGERVLVVDPCRAFGSGTHPSTRGCLAALARRVRPGSTVLDVGCGSGILAVAAGALGAARVVAIDLDPGAVSATDANAARNGVTVTASTTPVGAVTGTFDLVAANIGAGTLIDLAVPIAARVADDGALVLAGVLEVHAEGVASAYARLGLQLGSTEVDGGWAVQELQRGSTTAPS